MTKKKKILLLSDDLRMASGVGTMSKEFVMGTAHHYDWYQIGGAIKHPEEGKIFDISDDVNKERGIKDANVKVQPISGYGNPNLLRGVLSVEKPDAIMIYTDPRFWVWLFEMEHEVRQEIPIFYYNIWDDLPYPRWNENYYESCDLIMNISRQTVNIVNQVCQRTPRTEKNSTYIPHGINEELFKPLSDEDTKSKKYTEFMSKINSRGKKDFIILYNNRNIRRKLPGDTILAYKHFCDQLPKEEAKKCLLIMHTNPVDNNGTDLPAVVDELCPDYDVFFSHVKLSTEELNYLYGASDVTINMASNEGFGLTTCESVNAGTPIVVNVTGGLQDQCNFTIDGKYISADDYVELGSLHNKKELPHNLSWGSWVNPVWPTNRSLQGSPATPYIFDDRCRPEDIAEAIYKVYKLGKDERNKRGMKGRIFAMSKEAMMTAENMANNVIDAVKITGAKMLDVSTGVETKPGEKSFDKMRKFIGRVNGEFI